MNLGYLGCSYKHFAVKDLETLHISKEERSDFYQSCTNIKGLKGLALLMTCNRVEFYFESLHPEATQLALIKAIATFKNIQLEKIQSMLRKKKDQEVITHLFNVSCGLNSMVFGENEILSQVKSSHEVSLEHLHSPLLNKIFQSAIATGKRSRNETSISQGSYSISSIAIEAIRECCHDYFAKKILIIGAGIMAQRLLKKFSALAHPSITICNRSQDKSKRLSEIYQSNTLPFKELATTAKNYEIIFAATASQHFLISHANFDDENQTTPLHIIDLGVPRNICPSVDQLKFIKRLTITNLQSVADKNIHRRKKELDAVVKIINEEIKKVSSWYQYKKKHEISN